MTTLLVVEASTAAGSVALLHDGAVLAERDVAMGVSRDDALLPAIVDVLRAANVELRTLDGIVCGNGPGSFTSLRIAAALCKGLATANGTALYAVPSLLLAGAALHTHPGRYLVHSDALRGERFVMAVDVDAASRVRVSHAAGAGVVRTSLDGVRQLEQQQAREAVTVGTLPLLEDRVGPILPRARGFVYVAAALEAFGPVSLSQWEPEYGRLAEAQVKWESDHGRPLPAL